MRNPRIRTLLGMTLLVGLGFGLWRVGELTADARNAAMMAAQPTAVAVVDINAVLRSLDETGQREAELRQAIEDINTTLAEKQKVIEEGEADLSVLQPGTPAYNQKRQDMLRLVLDYRVEQEVSKQLIDEKRAEMHRDMFNEIVDAASRLAEREGYDLVLSDDSGVDVPQAGLNESQMQKLIVSRRVIYASDSADITDEVVRMMNLEFKK